MSACTTPSRTPAALRCPRAPPPLPMPTSGDTPLRACVLSSESSSAVESLSARVRMARSSEGLRAFMRLNDAIVARLIHCSGVFAVSAIINLSRGKFASEK
eukprot:5893266-Prymnesium_polylepis.1